ncbi:4-hydroxythreonine-4-phosphate dehydrogenase [hydrothermal vent metagenome]|uniref:4-hydroxythreonine-4-phosphate dehydrogenase n=1 Tax=hydrothermal vent metagenome TaxID=652676 RepID=A0A1W1EJI2_9ZZZZ
MRKKQLAISIGDLNGIGVEIALKSHDIIKEFVEPIYAIDDSMLAQASRLLNIDIPDDFHTVKVCNNIFEITPSEVTPKAGGYSYRSFFKAIELCVNGFADAILTLPIHKKAWEEADIKFKGHTDALRDRFDSDAIMMLGCDEMFVALYSEHIPLRDVASSLTYDKFLKFLDDLYSSITLRDNEQVAVLGLNPHSGDGGVLGDEEEIIEEAIRDINQKYNREIFIGAVVPDIAFTPNFRKDYRYFVALYHDQGLAPLKALYFDESINVSLNLPIIRVSVDHGTAFDIAYKNQNPSNLSYINAVKYVADKD